MLTASDDAHAIVAAIRELNAEVSVEDRGAYLRVLVPGRCVVTKSAIERVLGRAFRLRGDLEPLMPAFKGFLRLDDERAEWSFDRP